MSSSASCIKMELCSGNIGRLLRHPGTMTLLHPTYLVLPSFSWMSSRWLQVSHSGDMYARDRSVQWCGGLPRRRGWTAVCWPWESWVPARPDQVSQPPNPELGLRGLEMRLARKVLSMSYTKSMWPDILELVAPILGTGSCTPTYTI